MEDRLAVISCIISNPGSVATVNEKFHLQSGLIIARRSEEHTSELQSHYSISYAVFCLKKKKKK